MSGLEFECSSVWHFGDGHYYGLAKMHHYLVQRRDAGGAHDGDEDRNREVSYRHTHTSFRCYVGFED